MSDTVQMFAMCYTREALRSNFELCSSASSIVLCVLERACAPVAYVNLFFEQFSMVWRAAFTSIFLFCFVLLKLSIQALIHFECKFFIAFAYSRCFLHLNAIVNKMRRVHTWVIVFCGGMGGLNQISSNTLY